MTERKEVADQEHVKVTPEAEKVAEGSRRNIDMLAALKEFEKNPIVKGILRLNGISSVNEIFADDDIFFAILADLEREYEEDEELEIDPLQLQAFFEMAAKKCPWRIIECFHNSLMDNIDPEIKKRLWESVRTDENEEMPEAGDSLPEEDDSWVVKYKPPEKEEELIDPIYRLLVEPGHEDELPPEILELMALGGHVTFSDAMESEEVFEVFKGGLKALKSKIEPELYRRVLVVAAEQDDIVERFLKDYEMNSWYHAMQNHSIFKLFVTKGWLGYFSGSIKPSQLFHELITVAVTASSENAQWVLDKAKQDEAGETKLEGRPNEDSMYFYILQDILGKKVYKMVVKASEAFLAQQAIDENS